MENITENNKLIAKFMGEQKQPFEFPQFGYINIMGDWKDTFFDNQLKFHKDWNWLMKVVEKIHSMQSYGVLINPNGTYIQDEDDKVICMTFKNEEVNGEIISSSNIEATFNCCAEFVKWYNEQNK